MKKGWATKTLGEVLQKTETVNPFQSPETEFNYIDVSSVSNATFTIEETQRLKGKDAPSRARKLVRANDILFATIRPTLQRIAVVPEHLDKQVCSTGYFVFRPKPGIDHRFVFYSLFTENFMGQMESLQRGASYPAVTDGDVKAQMIPVPPLPEQQRIVGILDEAFGGIATAKANAEKNLQNARALFESHHESVFARHGEGWMEKPLREYVQDISTGPFGSLLHKSDYKHGGIPLVNPINIEGDEIIPDDRKAVGKATAQRLARYALRENDIVIGRRGEIGRCAVVTSHQAGWLCGTGCFVIRPSEKTNPHFLTHLLRSRPYRGRLEGVAARATMPNISNDDLANLVIKLPPVSQQRSTLALLESLSVETQRLESLYEHKLAALDALKKSLLHQAFTGRLTADSIAVSAPAPIRFPTELEGISTTDLHAGILALSHQFHEKAGKLEHFGHVKAEKIAHMIEARLGIDLGRKPMKDAAGPNDFPHLHKVEHRARKANFFDFKRVEGAAYRVHKLRSFDRLIERTRAALGGRANEVDGLLELMLPMQTQQAEIFCTVYAAWNNLLLDGKQPTDEEIVFEGRENWHPDKLKIPREKFFNAIEWIRNKSLAPLGKGKKVYGRVE